MDPLARVSFRQVQNDNPTDIPVDRCRISGHSARVKVQGEHCRNGRDEILLNLKSKQHCSNSFVRKDLRHHELLCLPSGLNSER